MRVREAAGLPHAQHAGTGGLEAGGVGGPAGGAVRGRRVARRRALLTVPVPMPVDWSDVVNRPADAILRIVQDRSISVKLEFIVQRVLRLDKGVKNSYA